MGGAVSEGHLLTIEEVADALRVSVRTVWRMGRDKQILQWEGQGSRHLGAGVGAV